MYLLGKQEALDWPLVGLGLRWNSVIGIRRGAADLEAFRAAKHVLDEGHVLAIFPEGTRSPDGALQEAKDGLAILALRTGATILPVGLANTDRFWPRGARPRSGSRSRCASGRRSRLTPWRRVNRGARPRRRPPTRSWAASPACSRRASAAPTRGGRAGRGARHRPTERPSEILRA